MPGHRQSEAAGTSGLLGVLVFLMGLLLASTLAAAQQALSDQFRESWYSADGLPHNLVNAVAQTPDGYLWMATWEGLARFNGRSFTVLDREALPSLADNGIRALHLDAGGRLWIGGARGALARLDADGWTVLEPASALIHALLLDREGRLWIATESEGVERIDPDGSRHAFSSADGTPGDDVYALAEDAEGRIWAGGGRGVAVYAGERFTAVDGLEPRRVFGLTVDGARLLVASERGAYALDADGFSSLLPELADEAVTSIARDAAGTLWFGTVNRGLLRSGLDGVEQFAVEHGLPNNRVLSLFLDRDQHMWVGTNAGLMRFRAAPFTTWTRGQGLPDDYVRALLEHSDGSLWIGTSDGIGRYADGRMAPFPGNELLPGRSVLALAQADNGDVWIGTFANGLLRWREDRVVASVNPSDGLGSNEVRALLSDGDEVWVGTANGLSHIDAAGSIRRFGLEDGLPGVFVVALHRDRNGRLWIGTGTGLALMEEGVIRTLDLQAMDGAEFVFGFHEEDDGSLWIASDRGLLRHRDGQFAAVGRGQGVPFDKLFNVVADDHGHFWIGTNRGVLRIDREMAAAVADGARDRIDYTLFGEADGMLSAQCNGGSGPSALRSADGSIWLATSHGATVVQPRRLPEFMRLVPPAVIEGFRADGVAMPLRDGQRLAAGTSRVEFEYVGLAYVTPGRIRYRVQLEGFDPDWVERGEQFHTEFTNLRPGAYRLRVQAYYPGAEASGDEASLSFSIAPFAWQRPVFWWLLAVAVLGAASAGYRWRLHRLRRNERRLREVVEIRTTDLREQTQRLQASDAEKTALLLQLREKSEAFERQAREDGLTGLANRRAFDEALAREFARAVRYDEPLSLALIDIDHFKQVNDRFSHAAGDAVLREVARLMRCESRAVDAVARWGGEEFAVLMPSTELDQAATVCERLRAAVENNDWSSIAPGLTVTVSIGIARHTGIEHHEKLLSRADAALYWAKQQGRNRISRGKDQSSAA